MVPSSTCPWMKVKHYFSSFTDAKSEQYVYTSLYDAEKNMAITKKPKMKCNLYAVIHSQIHVNMLALVLFLFPSNGNILFTLRNQRKVDKAKDTGCLW
jgi:hypothetical protein